jgi:hypothetical protein
MDRDRKRQILAAENTARLARALAAEGVYVVGDLHPHGLDLRAPDDPAADRKSRPSGAESEVTTEPDDPTDASPSPD